MCDRPQTWVCQLDGTPRCYACLSVGAILLVNCRPCLCSLQHIVVRVYAGGECHMYHVDIAIYCWVVRRMFKRIRLANGLMCCLVSKGWYIWISRAGCVCLIVEWNSPKRRRVFTRSACLCDDERLNYESLFHALGGRRGFLLAVAFDKFVLIYAQWALETQACECLTWPGLVYDA